MTQTNYLFTAQAALSKGDTKSALLALREQVKHTPDDIQSWHQLSLLEDQNGNDQQAGHAHRQCLTLAPNFAPAYIYAGSWLEKLSKEAAAAAFSIAFDLQPQRFFVDSSSSVNPETLHKTLNGGKLMAEFLKTQHQSASVKSTVISQATWVRFESFVDERNTKISKSLFAPELFRIDSIRHEPYYDANEFSWSQALIDQKATIVDELSSTLQNQLENRLARPYLPENSIQHGPLSSLAGSSKWSALDLYRDGVKNPLATPLFSETFNALSTVPTYGLSDVPFEAFFSVLSPGQSIAPHYGQSNHSLTVHLALDTPKDAFLEVADERRYWVENDLIIFDDSFLHSAHNPSNRKRTILLFSIWHPDLKLEDRLAVQNSFERRANWLEDRKRIIMAALPE